MRTFRNYPVISDSSNEGKMSLKSKIRRGWENTVIVVFSVVYTVGMFAISWWEELTGMQVLDDEDEW